MDRTAPAGFENQQVQKQRQNICSILANALFAPRLPANQKNLNKIDATLEKLYEQQLAGQTKLAELKVNLNKIQDKKNKIDPRGLPRAQLVANTKKRMVSLLHQNKQYQKNIDFFNACKYNLENNQMTREMADNIKVLKREMVKVGAINVEKLQDDVDDIAEMNADIQDVNNAVSDTMVNAWEMDVGDMEDELEAYLQEDMSDAEDVDESEVAEEEYVRPLVDPLARKRAEREEMERQNQAALRELEKDQLGLPSVPPKDPEEDVNEVYEPRKDHATPVSVHDF